MKLAIISDIHGNMPALEAVVEDIKQRDVDLILNLGDHLSGPLWPKETAEFLMKRDWIHIAGNHDRNLISQSPDDMGPSDQYAYQFLSGEIVSWLRTLKPDFTRDGLSAFHGTPDYDSIYLLEEVFNGRSRLATTAEIELKMGSVESPVILCGHSHIPRIINYKNSLVINPGSVGLQAYDDTEPEYHIMETGTNQACYALLDMKKNMTSEIIFLPYDHKSAVKQALKNGRTDWAEGLRSGSLSK